MREGNMIHISEACVTPASASMPALAITITLVKYAIIIQADVGLETSLFRKLHFMQPGFRIGSAM